MCSDFFFPEPFSPFQHVAVLHVSTLGNFARRCTFTCVCCLSLKERKKMEEKEEEGEENMDMRRKKRRTSNREMGGN